MKLSESEKKYTWKQWLEVLWLAIRHPLVFLEYYLFRKEVEKTKQERQKDIQKYIKRLEK